MITEDEFKEYIYSGHVPTERLPDGGVCFENIHITWFKTSEKLPEPNKKCYGFYLPIMYNSEKDCNDVFPIVRDNIRFNNKAKKWEWLFEAGYDYWAYCKTPDYWAYQYMPTGPAVI